jgi:hypothetical protein
MRPVERVRRLEIVPRAGLEAEPRHAARAGFRDDVAKHLAAKAAPARGLERVHRLHLAVLGRERLQRTDGGQRLAVPAGPERDVGRAQPGEIERMGAARRGLRPRGRDVMIEQRDDARIEGVAGADLHCQVHSTISYCISTITSSRRKRRGACAPGARG